MLRRSGIDRDRRARRVRRCAIASTDRAKMTASRQGASAKPVTQRLDRARSVLLIVDIQERLAPHILHGDALQARSSALVAAARRFGVPVLATAHCPDQIGELVVGLRRQLTDGEIFVKTRFGAADHPEFVARLEAQGRDQIVVAGIEAHVCVLQTVLGLAALGFSVTLAGDAVGSRVARQDDRRYALERMGRAGVIVAGTETVLLEWTHAGDDPAFRDVLALVKSLPPSSGGDDSSLAR
jgi:nicotinamidase-related amidase